MEDANLQMFTAFSGYNEGIYVSLHEKGHPALKEQGVRQALAYAIDRKAIVEDLLLGRTGVAATYWDNTPFVDPTVEPYPYDPAKANELLDAAGWKDSNGDGTRDKDGVELVLKYGTTTREIRKEIQAVFQQQFLEVGIGVELINAENFFDGYAEGGLRLLVHWIFLNIPLLQNTQIHIHLNGIVTRSQPTKPPTAPTGWLFAILIWTPSL